MSYHVKWVNSYVCNVVMYSTLHNYIYYYCLFCLSQTLLSALNIRQNKSISCLTMRDERRRSQGKEGQTVVPGIRHGCMNVLHFIDTV